MSRFPLAVAASLFAWAAAAPASGQGAPSPDCSDDRGVDRCAEAQQRRTREIYGVQPIEAHREAGDQVRRVFYVDGYGRDVVLIAFVRTPGRDPVVRVHYPQREGQPRPQPLEAPVPQDVWNEVLWRSRAFDRSFTPRPNAEPDICMHSWVYTVESVDRPRGYAAAELRHKTEDACGEGPASAYAREVQRLALPLVPACAALDADQHRNPASMLDACRMLHGDRLAAAEALNLAGAFRDVDRPEDAALLRGRFDYRATVDWNGARNSGEGSATRFWVERLLAEGRSNFFIESVNGENADRVVLNGFLNRSSEAAGEQARHEQARVEQIWVRDVNGEMKIERATVGPWRPVRMR